MGARTCCADTRKCSAAGFVFRLEIPNLAGGARASPLCCARNVAVARPSLAVRLRSSARNGYAREHLLGSPRACSTRTAKIVWLAASRRSSFDTSDDAKESDDDEEDDDDDDDDDDFDDDDDDFFSDSDDEDMLSDDDEGGDFLEKFPSRNQSRPNVRGDTRPNARGGSRPNARGESRLNARGESRPNARGESRPNVRGESRPNARGESRPSFDGVARGTQASRDEKVYDEIDAYFEDEDLDDGGEEGSGGDSEDINDGLSVNLTDRGRFSVVRKQPSSASAPASTWSAQEISQQEFGNGDTIREDRLVEERVGDNESNGENNQIDDDDDDDDDDFFEDEDEEEYGRMRPSLVFLSQDNKNVSSEEAARRRQEEEEKALFDFDAAQSTGLVVDGDKDAFFEFTSKEEELDKRRRLELEKRRIEEKVEDEERERKKKYKNVSRAQTLLGGQVIVEGPPRHYGKICGGCGALIGDARGLRTQAREALARRQEQLAHSRYVENMRKFQERTQETEGVLLEGQELEERFNLHLDERRAKRSALALSARKPGDGDDMLNDEGETTALPSGIANDLDKLLESDRGGSLLPASATNVGTREAGDDSMTIDTMDYGNAGYLDEDEEQEPDVEDEDPNLPAVVSGSARDLGLSPFKRSRVARDLYRGILCKRCKLLEKGDYLTVQKTLDKIDPNVFANQLASLKSQRVLIVKVVDALDFEGTFVRELRRLIGGNSVVLAVTKMDLIVAPDDEKGKEDLLKWFEGRLRMKGLRVEGKFAVSGKTGEGVGALAEFCVDRLMGRNLYVVGFANVGKSTLVNALKKEYVEHIFYRGPRGRRRKAKLEDSAVTVAALPGTTLRSIRIPVFRSHKHAMWDTPGLIIRRFLFPGLKPKLEEVARQPPERIRPQSFVLNAGEILVIGDNYAQLEIEPDDPTSTRRNSIEVRWYSLLCDRIQRFASYDEYLAQGGAERYPRSIEVDALSAQEKDEIKRAVYDGETSPPGAVTMLKRVKPARSQLQYPLFDVDVVLLNLGFFAVRAKNNFFKVKVYAPFFFQLIVRPSMPIPFASPVDGMISVRQARRLDQGQDGRSNSAAELLTADWGGISRKGGAGKQRWEESGDQRDAEGDFDDEEEAGGMAPYTLDGDDAGYQAAMLKQSREYSALRTVIRLDSGELVPVTESAWGALEELESEDEGDFATPDELLQRRDALLEEQSDVENNSDDDIESQLSTAASESESEERRREEARRSSLVVGSGQRLGGGLNIAAGSVVPTVDDEIFKEDDADWFSDKGSDDEGASASAAPAVSRAALEEEADLFDWSLAEEVPTSLTSTESDSSAELEVPKAVEEGQGMSEDVGGGSVRGRVEEDVGTVRGAGEGAARTGSVADDEESAEAASEPGTSVPAERSRTPASAGEKAVKQDAAPTDVSSSELEVDASNSQRSVEDNGSRAQTASAPEAESKVSADIGFELPRGRARKTFRSRGDSGRNLDQLAEEFLLARRSGTPGPPQMDNKEGNGGSGSWKDKIAAQNDQRRPTATRAEDSAQTADEDNFEKLFEEGW